MIQKMKTHFNLFSSQQFETYFYCNTLQKLTFAIILSVSFQYHNIFSLARLTPVRWHRVITRPVAQQNPPLTIWNPPRAPLSINCNSEKRRTLCYATDGLTIIIMSSLFKLDYLTFIYRNTNIRYLV